MDKTYINFFSLIYLSMFIHWVLGMIENISTL